MSDNNQPHVLIAGGTGLIGKSVSALLINKGWKVSLLSRHAGQHNGITAFQWNPDLLQYDAKAFSSVTHIVSLAGSTVSKRWSTKYKTEILNSRLNSAATLYKAIRETGCNPQAVITASATGFYGNRDNESLNELSAPGNGFLADTTQQWENAYSTFPCRVVYVRTGVVLSSNGGALPLIRKSLYTGVAGIPGNGKQYLSWIHIDDIAAIYLFCLLNTSVKGPINGTAPVPVDYNYFIDELRQRVAKNRTIRMHVPAFLIKWSAGDQSSMVLDSSKVIPSMLLKAGFSFKFPDIESALKDIYGRK